MHKVYYIGGSPCSGKSILAQELSDKFSLIYYKLDDHLDEYMKKAADAGSKLADWFSAASVDDVWLRDPETQCSEELTYYKDIFPFVMEDIRLAAQQGDVVAEGAGLLPELMREQGIPRDQYLCIVPLPEFQTQLYIQRPWIDHVLEGSSDVYLAFSNWMQRDILFAATIKAQAEQLGYLSLVTGFDTNLADRMDQVCRHFDLK